MKISSFSIIIAFACLFIIGLLLTPKLPVKLNPSRKIPVVNVSFSWWGQSARVVEAEVTSKLEAMLSRVQGVSEVSSNSSNGSGNVTIGLSKHVNPDRARFEISTVARQAWASLPQGVSYPYIYMSGTSEDTNIPFLRYTINAPFSPVQIQEYMSDNVKPKIAEIKGVDHVDVTGADRMIYKLEYDYVQLRSLGISVNDIRVAIQSYLTEEFLGIGKIEGENNTEQWIRIALISENRNQPFDPALIQVKNNEGTIVYLNRLVKCSYEEEEASSSFRINGLNSIYLSVTAKEDANQLNLRRQIQEFLEKDQKNYPSG